MANSMGGVVESVRAAVFAENARFATSAMPLDTSISDLAQAVGMQTSGINALAYSNKGSTNQRPIIIEIDKRELGRTVVDVGGVEETRIGAKLTTKGGVR